MKKINLCLLLTLFNINCKSQENCTEDIKIKDKRYLDISKDGYKIYNQLYKTDLEFEMSYVVIAGKSDEYDYFYGRIMIDLIKNKVKPNYLFEEKNYKLKKRFKDNHINYFRYNPLTADTLGGKLIESYQKYDSIYIGIHTWYDYELKNNIPTLKIEKQINYDTIYPICFSKAYKIARKKFGKNKVYVKAPIDYPNKKQEINAFWEFYDNKSILKIDAYSGNIID